MKHILIIMWGLVMQISANAEVKSIYDLKVKNIDGQEVSMANFKGKLLLIVNTASKCGFTNQYEGLEKLYANYKARGLVVLGFPSNDFGGQEPGTDSDIKKFCKTQFNIEFPMFAKGPVKGAAKQPLFSMLTQKANPPGEIKWNFEKFLVAPDGRVVARFESKVTPDSAELQRAIEGMLPK